MFHAHAIYALMLRPLVNAASWAAFALTTVIILAALTGIFVLWLAFIGLLITAIVISDVVERSRRWLSGPPVRALKQQPIA
jgi:hypothetical protein